MSYPPNVDGAVFLVNEILPIVKTVFPHIKLLVAGANPSNQVNNLSSATVSVSGWIDDIREAYGGSSVFIAPMRIGTGLQNKLLEAMAMQMPCVTTSFANRALGAEDGKSVLIGNTKEELANALIELLSDNKAASQIALQGNNFIKNKYSWESSSRSLIDIIK
jgi:glycosyltransferase involved in cell wall biosynthesis